MCAMPIPDATNIINEIRDYLRVADIWLREGLEDGTLSIAAAKLHAAELTRWQDYLATLEAKT